MNSKSWFKDKVIKKEVRGGASLNLEAYRRLKSVNLEANFGFALSVAWTSDPRGGREDGLCVVDMGCGYGA